MMHEGDRTQSQQHLATSTATMSTTTDTAAGLPAPKLPSLPIPSPTTSSTAAQPSKRLSSSAESSERVATHWNTHRLGIRVGIDAAAAASAGALVAPVITMIDKGIIENASGRCTLKESLKSSLRQLITKPLGFVRGRPFLLIMSLYFGTYFTANSIDTVSSTVHSTPLETTTSGTAKFVATSSANLALCLYKDSRFTQLFGSSTSAARPVPLPTFALFTVRDCLTIFASFNLPPLLAPHLDQHLSDGVRKYASAASVAQFVTPAAVQIFSTPLHLLGLDLYNRPNGAARVPVWGADGRVQRVVRDWGMSSIARMGRIVPAFGIGGVVNAKVRRGLMGKVG